MENTNTALSVYNFEAFPVRITSRDGSPWFVAKDVCSILGLRNITEAVRGLDDDEKAEFRISEVSQSRKVIIVSEPGMYRMTFRSTKDEARRFCRWVYHEILPAIRRNGQYQAVENALAAPEKIPLIETIIDMLRSLNERITAKENIPAHVLKYAWNLANVSRDVTAQNAAYSLLESSERRTKAENAESLAAAVSDAIDGAVTLPGMPPLDAECDRVFLRSTAVKLAAAAVPVRNPVAEIRAMAHDGLIGQASGIITRWPHRATPEMRRASGVLWNPNEASPVRVLDIRDGKITEIEKD